MSLPFDDIVKKANKSWQNVLDNNPFARQVSTSQQANPFNASIQDVSANPFLQQVGGQFYSFGQTDPYASITGRGSSGTQLGSLFTQNLGGGFGFNEWRKAKDQAAKNPVGSTGQMGNIDMTGADANGARGLDGTYKWNKEIGEAASQYGVPPEVIRAIMGIESGGDPGSISSAGAMGLMQVMPFHYTGTGLDGMDPATSINMGTKILAQNYKTYGSWDLAAAAYLGAIGKDANGNWVPTDAPDDYGTTGHYYVQLFKNNLAAQGWGQQQQPATGGSGPAGATYFPVQGYHGELTLHHGSDPGAMDIFADYGTPVLAMTGGTMTSGYSELGGYWATLVAPDGTQYYYAHLQGPAYSGPVQAGQVIGAVGDTGNARGTGPHLHIGIGSEIYSGDGPHGGAGNYNVIDILKNSYGYGNYAVPGDSGNNR